MKASVQQILKQKGYSPIFCSIEKTISDFKSAGYSKNEIKQTLFDFFSDNGGKIDQFINESIKYL